MYVEILLLKIICIMLKKFDQILFCYALENLTWSGQVISDYYNVKRDWSTSSSGLVSEDVNPSQTNSFYYLDFRPIQRKY